MTNDLNPNDFAPIGTAFVFLILLIREWRHYTNRAERQTTLFDETNTALIKRLMDDIDRLNVKMESLEQDIKDVNTELTEARRSKRLLEDQLRSEIHNKDEIIKQQASEISDLTNKIKNLEARLAELEGKK